MSYKTLINHIIQHQIPKMKSLSVDLVAFYEQIPNDILQEDMEEILLGFGEAVKSTEAAYRELLEMETEGQDITEQLNLVLGAAQRVLAAKTDMLTYLIEEGLDEYDLSHQNKKSIKLESVEFREVFETMRLEVERLAREHDLSLEVSQELLEEAWTEVGQEKLGIVIERVFNLIDEVISYAQDHHKDASINEYLDLRNQVKEVANRLEEELESEQLQSELTLLIRILSQLQIQQLLDLQNQIDSNLIAGSLSGGKRKLSKFIEEAQEIHEQMGGLLVMLEEIIVPSFLEDEDSRS